MCPIRMADQEVEHACSRNINWRSSKKQATKWKKSDISDMMYGFFHVTNSGWLWLINSCDIENKTNCSLVFGKTHLFTPLSIMLAVTN